MSAKKNKSGGKDPAQGSFNLNAPEQKASLASKAVPPPDEPEVIEAIKPSEEPAVPEEAIPVLTSAEPTNPEMSDPQPVSPAPAPTKKRSSKKSAIVVGISVMGSRLMGLLREVIFAYMFGAAKLSDVFVAAFRIPNLLRDLFAEGALSTRLHHDVYEDVGKRKDPRLPGISRGWSFPR